MSKGRRTRSREALCANPGDRCQLAQQLPPTITANTLSPGCTRTIFIDFDKIAAVRGIDANAAKIWLRDNVQKRLLEPEELMPMAVPLACDHAKGITGQEISVDGGTNLSSAGY